MIDPKSFYSTFQINYFDYKLAYLNYALEHFKDLNQEKLIIQYSEKDFIRAIKSDIRQTLFQAIETVFEIIFALTPDKFGKIYDQEILRVLSKGEFPYKKIESIAKNKDAINFLDKGLKLSNGEIEPLSEYIFYFGLPRIQEQEKKKNSLEAIKIGLQILASEFSDRREYNCYKHGLRIIPAMKEIIISKTKTKEKLINWDLTDSLTYYNEDSKQNKMEFITKVFDTERDKLLIQLCSNLLWNIIKIRDVLFNKLNKSSVEALDVFFFDKDSILKATKINVPVQNLRFSTTIK